MKKYLIGLFVCIVGAVMQWSHAMYSVDSPYYDYFAANKSGFVYVDHSNSSRLVYPANFFMPYKDIVLTGSTAISMSSGSIYIACMWGGYAICEKGVTEYSGDFEHHFTVLSGGYVLNKHTLFTKEGVFVTTGFNLSTGSIKIINNSVAYIDGVVYQAGKKVGNISDTKVKVIDDIFYKINNVVYTRNDLALLEVIDGKTFRKLKYNPLKKKIHEYYNPHYYKDKNNIYIWIEDPMPDAYTEELKVYNRETKRLKGWISVGYDGKFYR